MNAKNPTWFILFLLVCCSLLTAADTAGPRKKRAEPTKQPQAASTAAAPVAPPSAGISSDAVQKLQELGKLHEQGVLTDDEFATQKERLLAS